MPDVGSMFAFFDMDVFGDANEPDFWTHAGVGLSPRPQIETPGPGGVHPPGPHLVTPCSAASVTPDRLVPRRGVAKCLHDEVYPLLVPAGLVRELVDIFFDKRNTLGAITPEGGRLETALILNGIMALAARFSSSPYFGGIAPVKRGWPFAKEAQLLCANATVAQNDEQTALAHLQGSILLGFYHYTVESSSEDPSAIVNDGPEDWVATEELRRAWWGVCKLDIFSSLITRRPYTIRRNSSHVLLPVSDEAWLAGEPVASAFLGASPGEA
ncbi:hypothetical protein BJY01DRAFT_244832 [Aspergillus pseudoustus]|uniref:Xylanolytic transcriptional activator regulatory domain-containing protein n=1 Tax=Aspergillus pseudoustus TaxID=1810923 RepID=A0ABR4KI13_9EURO